MIDPFEPPTKIVSVSRTPTGISYGLVWVFQFPDDVMVRGVMFFGPSAQCLSNDPSFQPIDLSLNSYFQLFNTTTIGRGVDVQFDDLAFPLLKGNQLYWGIDTGSAGDPADAVQLIFTDSLRGLNP